MRAIVIEKHGGPEVLQIRNLPEPTPKAREVVIKVAYAGVNFYDVYVRTGLYSSAVPVRVGSEASGTVTAVGADVTGLRVGDRVATASASGAYADSIVIGADKVLVVPAGLPLRDAAAVILQGLTAHYLARSTFELKKGDVALVHAAAGGVGQLLVQIAKRFGARVIGTVSTDEKARVARTAGVDEIIMYKTQNVATECRRLTEGRGVDVAYDSVGAATWDQSLDALRPRGMMVSYGNSSGPVPQVSPLVLSQKGSLFLTRPTLQNYIATRAELEWRANDLFNWLKDGALHVDIDRVVPLEQAADAQRAIEARVTTGKVLLEM